MKYVIEHACLCGFAGGRGVRVLFLCLYPCLGSSSAGALGWGIRRGGPCAWALWPLSAGAVYSAPVVFAGSLSLWDGRAYLLASNDEVRTRICEVVRRNEGVSALFISSGQAGVLREEKWHDAVGMILFMCKLLVTFSVSVSLAICILIFLHA